MKPRLAALFLVLLCTVILAGFYPVFPVQIRVGASDPATCSTSGIPGEMNLFWNTTTKVLKYCSATNTWTALSGASTQTVVTADGTGSGSANYQVLTAGTGISVTPNAGAHTITVANTGATVTYSKTMVVGAENGAVLLDADLGPQRKQFLIPAASTITEIDVAADAGTPNVIVAKRVCTAAPCTTGANETVTNLLSSVLAAGPGTACAKTGATTGIDGQTTCSATLQNNTSIAAGTYIELVSGTAGGTAKRMSITVVYTTP